jgi:NTP pyrophosphatase (non-canonical NTP hydrolase)
MAKDHERKIQDIKDLIKKYCEDRDWDQFHGAKDLAVALSIEASELLEHFRFKSKEEVEELFKNLKKKEEIGDEMADILYFLFRLAQKYDIDLSEAFDRKTEKSAKKYPIEKARGSNKKYDELE